MRKITVGFSRPKKKLLPVFSWAIRLFEKTKYSHVFLSWHSSSGPEIIYEASGTRVRFLNKAIFDEMTETVDTFNFHVDTTQYRKLIKFCMTNVGTEYGFKQALGIALVRVFGLKKNPFSDGRASQVCSETVAYFLKEVMELEPTFDVDTAGPRAINEYLQTLGRDI